MKLALIGKGRWGTNIAATLHSLGVEVVVVGKGGVAPADVEGVIIATPSDTHADVALPYIKKGIPTFIEKPMTTTLSDAMKIKIAAKKSGTFVRVGHIYLHNPAFKQISKLLPKIGKLRYVVSEKMNFGLRAGESVFWDWLPHDLSMGITLFGKPKTVEARGFGSKGKGAYDFGVATFMYGKVPFTSVVHWRSPEKRKRTTFVGEKGTLVFDDAAEKKLVLHSKSTVTYPEYADAMPLTLEMEAFIAALLHKRTSNADLDLAMTVVRGIEAAQKSARVGKKCRV